MSLTPGFYGDSMDQAETEKTLRKALDLGVTLLNTADFYTSTISGETYQNLKLIGKGYLHVLPEELLGDLLRRTDRQEGMGLKRSCKSS